MSRELNRIIEQMRAGGQRSSEMNGSVQLNHTINLYDCLNAAEFQCASPVVIWLLPSRPSARLNDIWILWRETVTKLFNQVLALGKIHASLVWTHSDILCRMYNFIIMNIIN